MSLSKYPEKFDLYQYKKNAAFDGDPNGDDVMAEDINELQDAILAIEKSLGVTPQGNKVSVGERITLLEGSASLRVPSFLIYLGKPALINNSETTLEAIGHFSKYDHVVLGNEANDVNDPDHGVTMEIIDGVRANRDIRIYGYIDCGVNTYNRSISELQVAIQSWKDMDATGIYCANFGFEDLVSRERQNLILDSIHQHGMVAILDADNPEQVFSDVFHETMNINWVEPHIEQGDVFHLNRYALDSSRDEIFEPNVPQEIGKLIKLYDYRVRLGIQIFATPVIQTDVDRVTAQEYYDYAHVSALVTSMDAFHPVIEGYGEATNSAPTYDWVPLAGSWYMESPRIEYDETGTICVRETPFGRIILDTANHTYKYEGIYIPYDILRIAANSIEGSLIKDSTIDDSKIKNYDGSRLVDSINNDSSEDKIDINKIMDISADNIAGNIPASKIQANVIEAINANIGFARIGGAVIGDLTAGHIKSGTIDAGRITASVVEALNLYAQNMTVESATIGEAVIGNLSAEKITAGNIDAERLKAAVVEAINLSADQANIKNLNADNIVAGNIKAERIQADVINAMNLYAENMTAESAKINTATIGDLTAGHIRSSVMEAINLRSDNAVINSARIAELTAGHIEAAVIDAINLNAEKATIDEAVISDLSATKITAGTLDADIIKGSVIDAINFTSQEAVIDQAQIGDLSADKITTGEIRATLMESNVVSAINSYAENATIGEAKINNAAIGQLAVTNMSANVVDAINVYAQSAIIDKATIDSAIIGELEVDNLKASVIQAVNASIEEATIDAAFIGALKAENIKSEVIKAVNASVETITIGEGKIGDLSAEKIKAGHIDAERMVANVVEAINAEIQTAVIDEAKISDLSATKITAGDIDTGRLTANVVSAINSEFQNAVIDQAKIGDLNATKITAGDIDAERMKSQVVEAVNAYIENMTAGSAVIDSAGIGVLAASHMQVAVLSAINASVEDIKINNAKIDELAASHIQASVIDAINANLGTATIQEGIIEDLSAEKIVTGDLKAEIMTTNAIEAINADLTEATIDSAQIGELTAKHIQAEVLKAIDASVETAKIGSAKIGELSADNMKAAIIEAVNASIEEATINAAKIGELKAENIQAEVIKAVNASVESIKIKSAAVDNMTVDHIKAVVIDAINGRFGSATIDAAKIGVLEAQNLKAGIITSNHISTVGLDASIIKSGFINAGRIQFGTITGDHIASNTIATENLKAGEIDGSVIKGDTIHGSKIIAGTLSASNLKAGSITSVEIAAKTIQTRNLAAGAVDANVLRAGTIRAEHISTIGLDANQIEVFGNDGQVLIGDGYLRVDGLDVGVVQSDNLVGNGLFLTASSGFDYMRDNPSGEAVLGSQSKIQGAHQLWRINTTTGDKLAIDTGGTKPVDVAIDTDYEYVYVTLQGEDKLTQIQVSQGTLAARTGNYLKTGKGPGHMLFTGDKLMDHKHFFVLNTDPKDVNIPDSLTIIDAPPTSINQDLYVHHMIPLGNTPYDVVVRMTMEETTLPPGPEMPHPGHTMYTYVTLANQGDIAVLDMSHVNSAYWKVIRTIPIAAHMKDNYHGGLDGRFGLNSVTGGDSSSQYSDEPMQMAMSHGHGGYGTSDGSIREYTPHGIALSEDTNHIYVTDYANGHLLVIDVNGGAPYNALTGSRVTGNLGTDPIPPGGSSGGGTAPDEGMHTHAMSEEFSIQSGMHDHGGMDDSEPVHVPGMTGVITEEEQTTRYVRYRIPVGDSPERIEVVDGKVFVTLEGSNAVAVIDEADILAEIQTDYVYYGPAWNEFVDFRALPTWNVRKISVGAKPTNMTVSPDETQLYVVVNGQNQIAKIDITTEEITARFNTGPNPKGLKISPDGAHLYVVNHGGSGNLSFVYPEGGYIGDAYLGLEGGVEYQGAEHWVPNRSNWVYDPEDESRVQSASSIEFHINEPFLNEGGFTKISSYGIDPQWSTVEQDVFNVVNYSNGSNVAFATEEQLKQDASIIRFWPKNQWLSEYGVSNVTIYAKNDEFLVRDDEDSRIFYPSKNWIDSPERPVILVGLTGDFIETSENDYEITYGQDAKIVFNEAIPGDQQVYSSSYYYSEIADESKYTIYYEGDIDTSTSGTVYGDSHLKFEEGYLPESFLIKADYTFKHNRWFKNHNGSVQIATENSSSENFYVQFEIDEFVPKFITIDNQQSEPFEYWPIEVPGETNASYTGVQYSATTNRALDGTVSPSATPTSGNLSAIIDGLEPMTSTEEMMHTMEFSIMHAYGETVVLPSGLQNVVVDLGKTFMITSLHIAHCFHKNRQYHETKTEVSQDGIHWEVIYDSAVSGEYIECEYHAGHDETHYGKHLTFLPKPVRYIRDWSNGYTEWTTTSSDVSTWTQDTVVGEFTENHWTEIKAFGDWEFEKEFSRNYTSELLDLNPQNPSVTFKQGSITVTGGDKTTNVGQDNEQDVARIVDKDLLPQRYFSKGNGAATVTIDLGQIQKVDTIRVFRYYSDGREHIGAKTEISADGTSWTTIYDASVDGQYEEKPGGKILSLGAVEDVRYIRDSATSWTATLKTGTVITGEDIKWMGIHAYLDYDANYEYVYQSGAELEGQNLASNGQGIVTTEVSGAYAAVDIPIDFTSWWYVTYIVGPEFGQVDVEMPTVMGGSHSLFEDAPYLNKIAHRHIMSWPNSKNIKADEASNIKAGMHRAIIRQKSGKVSIDRFRFEDYQYLYMNSTEIPKGNATNFMRYKIEPEVAKWYVGRGNQSTEGAYDSPRLNIDTGKPDGSVPIKYRFRIKTRLQPQGTREERGIAYATSAIFETGRLSSHWRMSQAQDSFPGNRIQRWDPNQPHKTGIQHDHLANGAIRGNKIMPLAIMDHHISSYASIEESKLNLKHPTHRHGKYMVMETPGGPVSMWFDNQHVLDVIEGWGEDGVENKIARSDHSHDADYLKLIGGSISGDLTIDGDIAISGKVDGVDISLLNTSVSSHIEDASVHLTTAERTKLSDITDGATKTEASATNGKIKIDGVDVTVYTHPTSAGNKHIPTGGATGNYLKYSASGTAAWQNVSWNDLTSIPSTFTPPTATSGSLGGVKVGSGLSVDVSGNLSWTHPSGAGNNHVPSGGSNGEVLKYSANGVAVWGNTTWSEVNGKPSTFTPSTHTHAASQITDLSTILSGYATQEELAEAGEVKLDGVNTFTGQNVYTRADGPAVIIKPSSLPSANTILMQIASTTGSSLVTVDAEGDVVIDANLTVRGTTTYNGTNEVQGDYSITGNMDVGGTTILGSSATDQTTVKGDLLVEGDIKPKGKSVEVAKVPIFGIGGDLQFQTDSTTFEEIVSHYWTFNNGDSYGIPSPESGATRKYRLLVSYSTAGASSDAKLRVVQYGSSTLVGPEFTLPSVNGLTNGMVRHFRTPEFTTSYTSHTTFQAMSAGAGKDLVIKHIEVIAYDYYA